MDNGFLVTRIKIEEFLRSQPLDTVRDGLVNKANYLNCEISKNEMHLVDPTKVVVDCLNNMNLPCVDTMICGELVILKTSFSLRMAPLYNWSCVFSYPSNFTSRLENFQNASADLLSFEDSKSSFSTCDELSDDPSAVLDQDNYMVDSDA